MRNKMLGEHVLENRRCEMIRKFCGIQWRTASSNSQHPGPKPSRVATRVSLRQASEDVHCFVSWLGAIAPNSSFVPASAPKLHRHFVGHFVASRSLSGVE